ncbi:hypothetical protein PGT21_032509 [Puccinia graminis f. sp. tritici]|uniref:Uncharacterized protein n=1 Tax=Puccinia graminis f. sp. tritici TaxID=56615 RepID=A0A5B0NHP0_PUCGR|nr:hypothetical protein PGT21_032509 [Puccinia graminis f. sp. tritici]KAA1095614.1 hypothetical protein PGTUg99_010299 [Puccinia graminis f. sp. tritici]
MIKRRALELKRYLIPAINLSRPMRVKKKTPEAKPLTATSQFALTSNVPRSSPGVARDVLPGAEENWMEPCKRASRFRVSPPPLIIQPRITGTPVLERHVHGFREGNES